MVITGGTAPRRATVTLRKMEVMVGGPAETFRLTLYTAATVPLATLVKVVRYALSRNQSGKVDRT
jgi:hypothetical protein